MSHHILFVINGTDFGGTESALCDIACRLQQRGHRIRVLSLKPLGRVGHQLDSLGVPIGSLSMSDDVRVAAFVDGCWQLARIVKQHEPDIVHAFLPRANIMSRLAVRIARLHVPHISSERSTDLKRRSVVQMLGRATKRWTRHVLAISPEVRQGLIDREGVHPSRISVLGNGIDLARVDAAPPIDIRADLRLPPGCRTLCSAGRLVPDKGHIYLIRALAQLEAGTDVHLILVGDGPEQSRLREEAAVRGLSDRVHLLGHRSDLLGLLKTIDIFVLPSLEEGVSMAALEAMACGRPLVATDLGGNRTLMLPGRTGFVVPPAELWARGDAGRDDGVAAAGITALAEAVDLLIANPEAARWMGAHGRRHVEEQFTLDRVVTRLEHLYERLVAGSSHQAAMSSVLPSHV